MFIFCVKSSHSFGMGHLFRMLRLYRGLEARGHRSKFVLVESHPPAEDWLKKEGVPFRVVAEGKEQWHESVLSDFEARVWIDDRLQTDRIHAERIRAAGMFSVTFDNTGSGAELADVHISALGAIRGEKLAGKTLYSGLEYLIVPPEIEKFRRQRTTAENWGVHLGGSDTHGVSVRIAKWLVDQGRRATLLLGPGFRHESELTQVLGESSLITVRQSVPSLVEEFSRFDLAITGGGMGAFEAAAVGLPTLVIANETFEVPHGRYLESRGGSRFVGFHDSMDFSVLETAAKGQIDVAAMSAQALRTVGTGGVDKILEVLLAL